MDSKKNPEEIANEELVGAVDDITNVLKKLGNRFLKIANEGLETTASKLLNKGVSKIKNSIKGE